MAQGIVQECNGLRFIQQMFMHHGELSQGTYEQERCSTCPPAASILVHTLGTK